MITYKSSIGQPLDPVFYLENKIEKYPKELATGDNLGGFTAPYPIKVNPASLFATFGLWHGSNGVCVAGKAKQVLATKGKELITQKPLLVGDTIEGLFVYMVYGRFDALKNRWFSTVQTKNQALPKPLSVPKETYTYIETLHQTLTTLTDINLNFVDDFYNKVLPLCTASGNPIVIAPSKIIYDPLKAKAEIDIDQALEKLGATEWQF